MYIVQVNIHIKPEFLEVFRAATLENARNSLREAGIARFDVLQQKDDPTRWTLVEVYYSAEDQQRHRETPHYLIWRDRVADMMVEPRTAIKYDSIFPEADGWEACIDEL